MLSKNYFTKFLSALLSATIVTAVLPLDGIKVFAVDGNDHGYEIDDNNSLFDIYVFDAKTKEPIEEAKVDFNHISDPDHPTDEFKNFLKHGETDGNGCVSFDLSTYLEEHGDGNGWLNDEFDLSVNVKDSGYSSITCEKVAPNEEDGQWKTHYVVELDPSEYEDYITFSETDITYDGNEHTAAEFFTIDKDNSYIEADYDDEDDEFSFTSTGEHTFTIPFTGKGYVFYNGSEYVYEYEHEFTVNIKKQTRSDFAFSEAGPKEIDLSKTKTFVNTASSALDPASKPEDIKYYLKSESNVASVNETTGEVTFDHEGEVTIVAEMVEKGTYAATTAEYTITGKQRISASFKDKVIDGVLCGQTVPANTSLVFDVDAYGQKTLVYSLVDNEDNVAEITSDGVVTINNVGKGYVKVHVDITADNCYPTSAEYTINVVKGKHSLVSHPLNFVYGETYQFFKVPPVNGFTVTGANPDIFEIDEAHNCFTIKNIPETATDLSFEFLVSVKGTSNYEPFSGTVSGTIVRAAQNVSIQGTLVGYTRSGHAPNVDFIPVTGEPHGELVWVNDTVGRDFIDRFSYDTETKQIIVWYTPNGTNDPHDEVPIELRFTGDNNFGDITLKTNISISYWGRIKTDLFYNKNSPTGEHQWYRTPVEIYNDENLKDVTFKNPFDPNAEPAKSFTLSKNGVYPSDTKVYFYQNDHSNAGTLGRTIRIDQNAPEYFSVDIIDPVAKAAEKTPFIAFIDTITFGLYTNTVGLFTNNEVTVIVRVKDKDSGFGRIEYSYDKFTQDGKPKYDVATGDGLTQQSKEIIEYRFTIKPEARGNLKVRAYDYAGNCVATHDENGKAVKTGDYITYDGKKITDTNDETIQLTNTEELLVVSDTVSPYVTVVFDKNDIHNKTYFDVNRTATITFDEANFYSDDVKITVTKDGTTIVNPATAKKDVIDKLGGEYDYAHKTITVPFKGDGVYKFSIEYTDRSGNAAVFKYYDYENNEYVESATYSSEFIIDTVDPVVKVAFDINNPKNDSYFSTNRTATIEITEHNYYEKDLHINIKRSLNNETELSTVSAEDYIDKTLCTDVGDVHTIVLIFNEDADYDFSFSYKDRAERVGNPQYADGTVAKRYFTIDKTDPVVEVSYSNDTVYNGYYFNKDRIATITVTEHNFDKDNTFVLVKGDKIPVTWKDTDDKHVATVEFTKDDHYTFEITCVDKAGRSCGNVDFGSSQAPDEFILDKSKPTALTITIGDKSVLGDDSVTFDTFYQNAINITLGANCDISGLDTIEYQLVDNTSDYSITGKWETYVDGITVSDNLKFILYVKVTDKASNVSYANSTGIIVDNKEPEGERNAPDIDIIPSTPNANGYYKGDVSVQLNVVDPKYIGSSYDPDGYYSGLNKITYQIYTTDTDAKEEGTLLDLTSNPKIGSSDAKFDGDNLAASWSKTITIDSKKFNSNNIIIKVTAKDNAGNERVTMTSAGDIKIDVTAPTINVSYNNNEVDLENCFKADRVATVVITERNFDPKNVITTITSSNGNTIAVDGWAKAPGTGNGDNTKWTATITYDSDADYTFDIAFTDLAGNVAGPADYGDSAAPTAFTIDKTLPTVNVTYDNNDVANDMYYKSARTATITVVEHNFNASRVTVSLQASDDGNAIEAPSLSGWTTYGDTHTATISYSSDAKYVFDITAKDNAGNNSAEFAEQTFVVDTKVPSLSITGVVDKSANNGVVAPVITYSDTNFSADLVTINFSGASRGVLKLDGTSTDIHNGKTFVFNNFANEKSMDDIYTLEVTLTDLAGNTSTQKVQFSVNRFGSTYAMSAETKAIDGRYIQAPIDVVFTEVNPNALVDFKVTVFKNNNPVVLTKGVDYDVEEVGGEGTWREYKYIIHADNFADDGVYSVTIFSEDEAGNISENTLDTKNVDSKSSLQFGIDKTLPNIVASNLNSNTTYAVELYTVKLLVSDNLKLHSIDVYLDNSADPYRTWSAEEIAAIVSGEYVFNIDDSSTSAHTVRIVATDEAGNVQELTVSNFYVTTNLFVRYYTNTPLFVGSIIGFILLIALIIFIVVMSRRRKYSRR